MGMEIIPPSWEDHVFRKFTKKTFICIYSSIVYVILICFIIVTSRIVKRVYM